jgi:hypothetical protein
MVDDVLFFAVLILAICLGISVLVLANKESDMSSDQLRTLLSALIERPVPLGQVLSDDEATAVGTA